MTAADPLDRLVAWALEEDVGPGDWTTLWTVPRGARARGRVTAKAPLVAAGLEAASRTWRAVDREVEVDVLVEPGRGVAGGEDLLEVRGRARSILTGERTALNFLGRLSGVATLTRRFVEAVSGTGARIVDTRKTTPGWRLLEKEAVRLGGGTNHRMGLHDMVLIKENHIAAAGGVTAAVEAVRRENRRGLAVEVEVTSLDELREAVGVGVDRVLLDNMDPERLRRAVEEARGAPGGGPELEASGNVTLATVREVAATGVDLVSVGALTHSAPAADVSLRVDGAGEGEG